MEKLLDKNNIFNAGAFGVIFDNKKRVLLCHRTDYDIWNLPGGRMEKGETPWECVVREIKEETGFKVELKKLVGIYYLPNKVEIIFSYLCEIKGGKLILNDEADRIEFFDVKKLPKNIVPKHVDRIKDALQNKNKIVMKRQAGITTAELIKKFNKK